MKKEIFFAIVILMTAGWVRLIAVEIPLESLTPARVGFVDLQKVFDLSGKVFCRRRSSQRNRKAQARARQRQNLIATIRQQISADQSVLTQAQSGASVQVPVNNVPDLTPARPPAPVPAASTTTVKTSTTVAVEPYPLEDPLAGLPGHDSIPRWSMFKVPRNFPA